MLDTVIDISWGLFVPRCLGVRMLGKRWNRGIALLFMQADHALQFQALLSVILK
jgi:hypothetical protein